MVISHAQPLLLLFVSLFFIPAAFGTNIEFYNCPPDNINSGVVKVTKVEIIPYPINFHDNPIFKITGVTPESLGERLLFVYFNLGRENGVGSLSSRYYNLCHVTKCPIAPGPFVLTLTNIYSVQRNDHLSGEYNISMYLHESLSAMSLSSMCTSFKFHASALAEFTNIQIADGANASKVEILPFHVTVKDNPVFRITAVTPKTISSSSTLSAIMIFEGGSELFPRSSRRGYKLCDSSYHCPVLPGPFVLTIPHPYWRYKMEAGRYRVEVQIVNQNFPFHVTMNLLFWFRVSEA